MALSANTNVAAAVANYFADNFQALQLAGAAPPPPTAYTVPPPSEWRAANQDKQFYLIGSGATYKLASVSGSDALPEGAVAVDLNVAYAIESKELSLTDWVLARVADEIRQSQALDGVNRALTSVPEANVTFDLSSMNQADLQQLLQRLVRVSQGLQSTVALGNLTDRQLVAAALGLAAGRLSDAIEQQALFSAQADTLSEQVALKSAQDSLASLQNDPNARQSDIDAAQQRVNDAQAALDAANNFNDVTSAALALLVQNFTQDLEGLGKSYDAKLASVSVGETMSRATQVVTAALTARLRSAADLALLATSAEAMFLPLANVLQTSDGNVLQSAATSARASQKSAVEKVLIDLVNDPGLQTALVDAMKASAETLGTADMDPAAQEVLYKAVAGAVVQAALADANYIDDIATQAVDFGKALSDLLSQEAISSTTRDSVLSERMA